VKRVLVASVLVTLLAGCSSSGGATAAGGKLHGSITVDAAASLTEAFTALKASFEKAHPGTTVTLNFGASSELATQIQQGQPADVFASASEKNMAGLGSAARRPADFVRNRAALAVPASNPGHVANLNDLARPGLKIALCDATVPCGVVARQVFANAGITVHPAASLADVKSTLAAVESGEVDAGVVYVTDVRAAGAKVKGIEIPTPVNASTTYPIAVLKDAKNPALAKAWVAYVRSVDGRKVLQADGFARP
jgi:molybdate transport system substrate-binding protein